MNIEKNSLILQEHIGELNDDHKFLHDNEYIHTGYRLYFNTCRKILRSLFLWHNESVNIWSHGLGLVLFIGILIYCTFFLHLPREIYLMSPQAAKFLENYLHMAASAIESFTEEVKSSIDSDAFDWISPVGASHALHKVSRWPLFVFITSAMICLGMSALYHLFNAHSYHLYKLMSRFDYAGISLLICGSFYPPIYYMYFCRQGNPYTDLIIFYLTGISIFSALVFVVALLPSFQAPKYRWFRGGIFLALGLTGIIPCVNLAFM